MFGIFGKIKPRFKSQKEYNRYKVFETQNQIWDWEFKRFKNRVERERYRSEYDAIKSKLEIVNQNIAKFPALDEKLAKLDVNDALLIEEKKKKWSDEQLRVDDEKIRMERDLKVYENSMKSMDDELNGVKASAENPNPAPGIEDMINAFRDLKNVYEAYIKVV